MFSTVTSDDPSPFTEFRRSLGTFVGLAVIGTATAFWLVDVVDNSWFGLGDAGTLQLAWLSTLIAAVLATVWLDDGGYERIGADPTGGGRFAWLVVCYVPFATSPTWLALDELLGMIVAPQLTFQFVVAPLSVWLAFYGGLDRLGIELRHVGHAAVASIVFVVVGYAVWVFLPVWATGTTSFVGGTFAVQLAAVWVGGSGVGDRLLE